MLEATPREGRAGIALALVISLSVSVAIHILVLLRGFYSATADESGRTLDAHGWIVDGDPLATVWLPFYKILIGSALAVFPDLFITPRFVSFLFGELTVAAVVVFTYVLFHDRFTTLLAGILAALFPPRVVLSVVPLAEIMFAFAIVTAMIFLVRFTSTGKLRHLLFGAVALAVSETIRYEGWIFAAALGAMLVGVSFMRGLPTRLRVSTWCAVFCIVVAFPLSWVGLHWFENGLPFGFVTDTSGRYFHIFGESRLGLFQNNPLVQFASTNFWTLNILGLIGMVSFLRADFRRSWFLTIPALALVVLSAVSFWGKGLPTHSFWRIPFVWSLLIIPFTAYFFHARIFPDRPQRLSRQTVWLSLLLGVVVLFLHGIYADTKESGFSQADLATGTRIRQLVTHNAGQAERSVLIESDVWTYLNVMVSSENPQWFVYNTGYDPLRHEVPIFDAALPFDVDIFRRLGIHYFIFRRDDYRETLDRSPDIVRIETYGPWTIYGFRP